MKMFDLSGRVAVVTGGNGGIGLGLAQGLAEAGAAIVIAARDAEKNAAAVAALAAAGAKAIAVPTDIRKPEECKALVERAVAEFGRVDILVNNAGMSPLAPSLSETSEELFDKIVDVNFKGPFRLSSLIGERMVKGDGGVIINLSSTAAFLPMAHTIPYGGAKAAIGVMTVALAKAFAPKVRVNCIAPGPFLTDVSTVWRENEAAKNALGLKRFGEPEEIVGTALYLASDASSYTTGQVIRVDGGSW
jgi:NAD(P)-dependent dehydrogenase (short-subunit alcohol dehydrogenase family)